MNVLDVSRRTKVTMAKFTFKCIRCGKAQQLYVGHNTLTVKCSCGESMERLMPNISRSSTFEQPDKESGKQWLEDQPDIIKARKEKFYWGVEVPRFVASGTYSVETMLSNGWISLSDDGKIVVNTKPPSQR